MRGSSLQHQSVRVYRTEENRRPWQFGAKRKSLMRNTAAYASLAAPLPLIDCSVFVWKNSISWGSEIWVLTARLPARTAKSLRRRRNRWSEVPLFVSHDFFFWFLLTQEDSVCLCHLHAAKLIINRPYSLYASAVHRLAGQWPWAQLCCTCRAKRALSKRSLHYPHPVGLLHSIW